MVIYGQHFSSTCLATLLQCKLKLSVARMTTCVANSSRNKIPCCKLKRRVAKSRLEFYFLQQILVLLLVLPLKLQLVSQQIWLQRLWLAVSEARLRGKLKKKTDYEKTSFLFFWISGDTFPNKKQNCSLVMQKNSLYATTSPTSSSLINWWNTPLSSLREIHCRIHTFRFRFRGLSSSSPCKRPKQSAASTLLRQTKSSRRLCLHKTDQSYAQDSANLQQYVLLRNKLVIRATESFNLHCNNVARQVEEKCCPYYRTLNVNSNSYIIYTIYTYHIKKRKKARWEWLISDFGEKNQQLNV